jgi:hypothetical protein
MIGPILLLILAISFLAYVALGATYLASREGAAMSWTKIVILCIIVFCIIGALAGWHWAVGEEDLSGLSLLIYPVGAIGILVCLSSAVGTTIGIYRRGNGS